jgi:hypothetical protein
MHLRITLNFLPFFTKKNNTTNKHGTQMILCTTLVFSPQQIMQTPQLQWLFRL